MPLEVLVRHKHGDSGKLPPEDVRENERFLAHAARLFSAYWTHPDEKLWVITEGVRSVTALLLTKEYKSQYLCKFML